MLRLVLFQPDIPQNAGTILRLCACLGVEAGIVEPASFPVSDRHFRRAGLDYLDGVRIERYASFAAFEEDRTCGPRPRRLVLLTTAGDTDYLDYRFRSDDILMVGRESAGVPDRVHASADARLHVAMMSGMRSLNVAVAAAMVLGEALRQVRGRAEG